MNLVIGALVFWLAAFAVNVRLAASPASDNRLVRFLVPLIFGVTILVVWELLVRGLAVPRVILPPPSVVYETFISSLDLLWADFLQTVIKGALSGFVLGCGSAVVLAVLIDRSPFLQNGLLPLGNLLAALPIVGTAPILVMWFGFDWHSKAAVVVLMVFFPTLVNTVEGLASSDVIHRELMKTYAAGYWQTLVKLRLPAAMPFVFNGLKISTALSLIGAIVAEFFGSPIVGMGFRISTEVGKLALDMVWAEIAVAAIAGSAFYGAVAAIERGVTFWHPSQRG